MLLTEYSEIVYVTMKRKGLKIKDVANLIGKSSNYTRQVIDGSTQGPAAEQYRRQIAKELEITLISEV